MQRTLSKKRTEDQEIHTKKKSMSEHYEKSSLIEPFEFDYGPNKPRIFESNVKNDVNDNSFDRINSPNKTKKENPSFFKKSSVFFDEKLISVMKPLNLFKKIKKK